MPSPFRCEPLPAEHTHLLNRFYRQHGSRMKAYSEQKLWTLQSDDLLACLCLQPVQSGHWLTGLFVAPEYRGQGLATHLLEAIRKQASGPLWLFCSPELQALYTRCGYAPATELPESLAAKLKRYQQGNPLIAMVHPG
ncbi:MAG: GNAT family N-acetyltransferase [Pseudomonas sp.]